MTPEARAARERKQKIFVVVGAVFLVAMLAFQLPKLLGGSSSDSAAAPSETPTVPGTPASPGVTPVPVGSGVQVAETGKLTSFSVFVRKDPFVQQVVTESSTGAAGDGGEGAGGGGKAAEVPTKEFSTDKSPVAAVTIVTVNGARQMLEPGMKFPASDPLFVLVAEKPDAKAVVIGVAGGAYSGGARTTTLKVGKPLTLVNTTTGARYKVSLVSVGSGDSSEQPEPAPKP